MEKLGDALIVASMALYLLATTAYLIGKRPWDALYWAGCCLINLCVLMLRHRRERRFHMEQLLTGRDWYECDLCNSVYHHSYMENFPLPHLVAWKATLCMDCIRSAAAYDDGEEVGTGSEGMVRDEEGE